MKILASLITVLFAIQLSAQDTTLKKITHSELENLVKIDRAGMGNSQFKLSISKLSAIPQKISLKALESQLGKWTSSSFDNSVGYLFNDKTRDHDIPNFQLRYYTEIDNTHYTIEPEVSEKLSGKIHCITITAQLNGMTVARLKKSLQDSGFLINENLSYILRKQCWQKKGSPTFAFKNNANGTISIKVF